MTVSSNRNLRSSGTLESPGSVSPTTSLNRVPSIRDLLPVASSPTATPPLVSPRGDDAAGRIPSPRRDDNNSPARVFTRSVSPQSASGKMLRGVLGAGGMRDSPVRKQPNNAAEGEEKNESKLRESGTLSISP